MVNHPRDMRDWMHGRERSEAQQRAIPALMQTATEIVRDESAKDLSKHPAAPIELEYQTAYYIDTVSRRRVRFLLEFPDVIFNTDATPAKIQQYELWAREESESALAKTTSAVPALAMPGISLPSLAATVPNAAIADEEKPWLMVSSNTESFFRAEGFIPGSVWRLRARAIGVYTVTPGEWSEEIVVQMLDDTDPPPMPTAPTLNISRGTITATWNGQAVSGAMPPDFKYAILAHGTDSSPTFEIARFGRGGGFKVVADLPYYDPQFFRLRAVDESGNEGPWSEQAVGFTTPLVDRDVILSTIDAAKTHLKNINAGVSILPNTIITEHLVVTEEMSAAIGNFLHLNVDHLDVNSLWADESFFGLADAKLFRGDAFEGKAFTGGTFTGPTIQTSVEEYTGLKLSTDGIIAYSATGVETFRVDAATGNVTASAGTFTGMKFQTSFGTTTGLKVDGAGITAYEAGGVQTFRASAYDGSVTASKGTFTGMMFQTESTIDRGIKFDSAGIYGYDSAGTQVFSLSAVNGRASLVGRIRTGAGTPGVTLLPAEESSTGTTSGMFISPTSTLTGLVTAGAWVTDAGSAGPQTLWLRGMNDGDVAVERGNFIIQNHPTTSSAANAVIGTSPTHGMVYRSTSSLRYKTDVQPWDPAYRVLGLETYSWVDRNPMDAADPLKRYYGLTAEQTFEVMPELVTLNEFDEPDAVQYERVGPALIPVVRDLLRRIEILEGK